MKKSIKRACALALLATSASALASTSAVVFQDNQKTSTNTSVYALTEEGLDNFKINGTSSVAYVGSTYKIPEATFKGSNADITKTVTSPIGADVKVTEDGTFEVKELGTYVITYTKNGFKADYTVTSQVSKNKIVVDENSQRILPKYVYASYKGEIKIPNATVEFEDVEIKDYKLNITVTSPKSAAVLTVDENGVLQGYDHNQNLEVGTYSIRYVATTKEGVYLDSLTKDFVVMSDAEFKKEYGSLDYTLKFEYSKTTPTGADIGKEVELPTPKGKMGTTDVPVYYQIQAKLITTDGKEVDVTNDTIKGNKFTAKKSYTVGETVYNAENASYQFYYDVTDALGKKAEKSGFMITGVKDTLEPEIIIADPYDTTKPGEVEDVEYKLQSDFANGENIVIKAMFAKDAADEFKDLTLTRYIRKDTQSSTEEDIYSDSNSTDKTAFAKDLVFNVNGMDIDPTKQIKIDKELEAGTYKVYYKAVDKAGKTKLISYKFTVSKTFNFSKKPTVEFGDAFLSSVEFGSTLKFSKPIAKSEEDERLNTFVMYKFDNEETWTTLTNKDLKDNKFSIDIKKEAAKNITIRAVTESDANDDFDITQDISSYSGLRYAFDEVTLNIIDNQDQEMPTILSLADMEPSYQQNTDVVLPDLQIKDDLVDYLTVDIHVTHKSGQTVDVEDAVVLKTFEDGKKGTYTLTKAKFYATLEGQYDIVYEITDAASHKVFLYQKANILANAIVSDPAFGKLPEALNEGKLELGEKIELPIPELPSEEYGYSVNVKGKVGSTLTKEIFEPKQTGTYKIIYNLFKNNDPSAILDTKEFMVEVKDTTAPELRVEWNLNPAYEASDTTKVLIPTFSASDLSGINLEKSKIVISSKSYSRTIKGSDMAKFVKQYEEYVANPEGKEPGDLLVTLRYNEEYKVTYTVYDKSNDENSTSESYSIKVGDLVTPTITVEDSLIPETMKIDSKLTIDLSKIKLEDNETASEDIKLDIKVRNTTTNVDIKNDKEDEEGKFVYSIKTAGKYEVRFIATDNAGQEKTIIREFTVNEQSSKPLETNEVIAIVACSVAVVILAGAIVYMVITKKKLKSYK